MKIFMEFCKPKEEPPSPIEEPSSASDTYEGKNKSLEEGELEVLGRGKLWATVFRWLALASCLIVGVVQLSECYHKLIRPPILTHTRFHVNNSLWYPALTICREPPYRADVLRKYGLGASPRYTSEWRNFPWGEVTLEQFFSEATYPAEEVLLLYGLKNHVTNVELSSSFFFESGACHTLKPKATTQEAGIAVGYSIIFRHSGGGEAITTNELPSSPGWHVYVHEPSETWTEKKMQSRGRQEALFIEAGEEVHVKLSVQEFLQSKIGHKKHCAAEVEGGEVQCLERCRWEQIAVNGCGAPWLTGLDLPECDNYNMTSDLIIKYLQYGTCSSDCCGCASTCRVVRYEAVPIIRKPFLNSLSQMYVFFNSRLVTLMEEKPAYHFSNFFTDVGAILGFLLGLSVIGFINLFEKAVDFIASTLPVASKKIRRKK